MSKAKYTADKDGRYRTSIRTGKWDENGKPICIRVSSTKSSADLEKKVREIKYELEHGKKLISDRITFEEYSQSWLKTKSSRSVRTKEQYSNTLKLYCDYLNPIPMTDIRKSDVQAQINKFYDKPRTCEIMALTFRQIFDMALDEGVVEKSPCRALNIPRKKSKEKRVFTKKEKKIIRNASGLDEEETVFIHLLYGTGMRPGELYALTWDDIGKDSVHINKALQFRNGHYPILGLPKTDASVRTIPLPSFLKADLKALKSKGIDSPTQTVIGALKGEYWYQDKYRNMFKSILRKLGLVDITPYQFRHEFCTMCYESGIDLKTCQYLMGHTTTKMVLEVYTHLDKTKNALAASVKKINF